MFKILVVEDDKNLRKLITTYLRKNEYITYEATNGEEALEIIDTNYIDLIISDIMMEKMDGYELTKVLREGLLCYVEKRKYKANDLSCKININMIQNKCKFEN